MPATER
ncbi:hypothetical protein YPPY60_4626, partial [Yersinia pestis PY-60]